MKYVFIMNPAAGIRNPVEAYKDEIEKVCAAKGLNYEFAVTEKTGHATELAAKYADEATESEPMRIFAAGGDGTLCEVANGVMGKPNCELGAIPCGSGNDYIRSYGKKEEFFDFENYICSGSVAVDGIRTTCEGTQLNSLNIASLGFDANVCNTANELKLKNKKLSGSKAYNKAILINFFRKLYNTLTITIDDSETFSGKYLFSVAANGQYYGGGINSAPMADPTDHKLEMVLVNKVGRLKFPTLVGPYTKGTYMGLRRFKKIVTHRQATKMYVKSKYPAIVNVDGECFPCDEVTFEIMPAVINFIVPQSYLEKKGININNTEETKYEEAVTC